MKTISTRKLIKNAFLAIFKPHKAFKKISPRLPSGFEGGTVPAEKR